MADCIRALITANIKTAIEGVKTPAYNTDVNAVEETRENLDIDTEGFVLLQEDSTESLEDYQHTKDEVLPYTVVFFGQKNDEKPKDPFAHQNRNVVADITKAIMADRTRGGYALNTHVTDDGHAVFVDGQGNQRPGTYLLVNVDTHIDADDPYQLAQ